MDGIGNWGAIWATHNKYSTNGYGLSTIQADGAYGSDYFIVYGSDTRWTGGLPAGGGQNFIGRGTPGYQSLNGDVAEFVVFTALSAMLIVIGFTAIWLTNGDKPLFFPAVTLTKPPPLSLPPRQVLWVEMVLPHPISICGSSFEMAYLPPNQINWMDLPSGWTQLIRAQSLRIAPIKLIIGQTRVEME